VLTVRVKDRDRYGRVVADVILPDGRILNHKLVRAGFAWWFRRFARTIGPTRFSKPKLARPAAASAGRSEAGAALGLADQEALARPGIAPISISSPSTSGAHYGS